MGTHDGGAALHNGGTNALLRRLPPPPSLIIRRCNRTKYQYFVPFVQDVVQYSTP